MQKFIQAVAIAALVVISGARTAVAALSFPLPQGWHQATVREVVGDEADANERQKHSFQYMQAPGDFDGNGREDRARILIRNDGKDAAIFITMQSGSNFSHLLFEHLKVGALANIFVDKAPPGTYVEFDDSNSGKARTVVTTHDGFLYGTFESSTAIVYWDERKKSFQTLWMSD